MKKIALIALLFLCFSQTSHAWTKVWGGPASVITNTERSYISCGRAVVMVCYAYLVSNNDPEIEVYFDDNTVRAATITSPDVSEIEYDSDGRLIGSIEVEFH